MPPPQSSLIASPGMEAAAALADLVEISPQIEAATVFDENDEPLGSIGVSDWWAEAVARTGRTLLEEASDAGGAGAAVTQIHASLRKGDVFAVGSRGERAIVAVTAPRQAPGLLFYDLKRCLASLEVVEPEPEPEPAPEPGQRRRWGRRRKTDDAA
jgi:opacity protein-like surface antigen